MEERGNVQERVQGKKGISRGVRTRTWRAKNGVMHVAVTQAICEHCFRSYIASHH